MDENVLRRWGEIILKLNSIQSYSNDERGHQKSIKGK